MKAALPALLLAVRLATALAPEPETVASAASELAAATSHFTWQIVGQSGRGRPIGLLVATSRPTAVREQLRLMVIARQHGDEVSPANAALLWMRTNAVDPAAFRDVAVLLVPTLNPDGAAAGLRANGAGVDLNRDWMALSQPETQLVDRLIRVWQPHVLVDLHEFDGLHHGRRQEEDWIEILETGRETQDQTAGWLLHELVASQRQVGEPVRSLVVRRDRMAVTLCHRAVALRHRLPALLVEVGDRRADPGARVVDQLVSLMTERHEVLKPRLDALRGLPSWHAPEGWRPVAAGPDAQRRPELPPPLPPSPWPVAIGFATILLSVVKFRVGSADT